MQISVAQKCTAGHRIQIFPHFTVPLTYITIKLFFHLTAVFSAASPEISHFSLISWRSCTGVQAVHLAWRWGVHVSPFLSVMQPWVLSANPSQWEGPACLRGQKRNGSVTVPGKQLKAKSSLSITCGTSGLTIIRFCPGHTLLQPYPQLCTPTAPINIPWKSHTAIGTSVLIREEALKPTSLGHLQPKHRCTAQLPFSTGGDSWVYPSKSDLCVCVCTCVSVCLGACLTLCLHLPISTCFLLSPFLHLLASASVCLSERLLVPLSLWL